MKTSKLLVAAFLVLSLTCGISQAAVPDACKRGVEAAKRRQYDLAIQQYSQCIKSGRLGKKELSKFYVRRSLAWSHKGQLEKSLVDVNKAIGVDPKNAPAYMWRGGIWAGKLKWDKAFADYDKTIKLKFLHPVAFWGRGAASRVMGKYDQAIADFNKAIKLNPKFADAYCFRCQAWWAKHQYDKAMADCNKAVELKPQDDRPYFDRGNVWFSKRQYDKAIADYTKAIKLDPKLADAYYNRAMVWKVKRQYAKAIKDYNKAIELDPNNVRFCNSLAWLLATCPDARYRDGKRAVQLATKATRLKPKAPYFDTLAAAHAEAGDYKKAVEIQAKAIKMLRDKKASAKRIADYDSSLQLYKSGKPLRK